MRKRVDEPDDNQLVAEAKKGNLEAFGLLVERYQNRLYQIVRRFVPSHEDADDLIQETWMQAFRALPSFREEAGFYTWIYRIALNLTINFLRKQKKEKQWESYESWEKGPEENLGKKLRATEEDPGLYELREKIEMAIKKLPLPYRSAFILVTQEGLNYRQVAKILGCSENTVAWRMFKAREKLQKELQPYLAGRK
jgi:RNA polymerase sigma-70 factor (ECF subfamily)